MVVESHELNIQIFIDFPWLTYFCLSFHRNVQSSPLSVKDQEEKARRSEFVQGLLLSTVFEGLWEDGLVTSVHGIVNFNYLQEHKVDPML